MPTRARRPARRAPAKKTAGRKPGRTNGASPTPAARDQAAALSEQMPFVHFPANTRFADWMTWGAFRSRTHRGEAPPSGDPFDVLPASHVYAYAGPCCFAAPQHGGDAAAWLDPELDRRMAGEASPFDSGALDGDDARLRTWAAKPRPARWKFFQKHVHPLTDWRRAFEA